MFQISFRGPPADPDLQELSLEGSIITDNTVEGEHTFLSPTTYWPGEAYEEQWQLGIERILGGWESSCLLTSVEGTGNRWHVFLFELHSDGEDVWVTPRYIAVDQVPVDFDPSEPYSIVEPAASSVVVNGRLMQVERWLVKRSDLAEWATARA
jgi:hypothetical protein